MRSSVIDETRMSLRSYELSSDRIQISILIVILGLAALPLITTPLPPLIDYPSHLTRIDLLARWSEDPLLREHYELSSWLVPNIAFDAIGLLLARILPLDMAGRVFIFLCQALMVGGTVWLHRELHRQASLWPLLSALLAVNFILLFGFMSYVAGVGVMLVALALWLRWRQRPWWQRLLAGSLAATALFFCHAVALALYALVIAGYELQRSVFTARTSVKCAAGELALGAATFLPALALLLASPTGDLTGQLILFNLPEKILSPFLLMSTGIPLVDLVSLPFMALLVGTIFFGLRLRLASSMTLALIFLLLAFLFSPASIGRASFLDSRMPLATLLVAIAATDSKAYRTGTVRFVILLALALFVFRTASVGVEWHGFGQTVRSYEAVLDPLKPSGILMIAREAPAGEGQQEALADLQPNRSDFAVTPRAVENTLRRALIARMHHERVVSPRHLAIFAARDEEVFVPMMFADDGLQPIIVREPYRPFQKLQKNSPIRVRNTQEILDLARDIRQRIDGVSLGRSAYLLLLTSPRLNLAMPPGLLLKSQDRGLALYEIPSPYPQP